MSTTDFLVRFAKVVGREAANYKTLVVLAFAVVSIGVLLYGVLAPKHYRSFATLYIDQAVESSEDYSRFTREVEALVRSPELLSQLKGELGERTNNALSQTMQVKMLNANFTEVSVVDEDPVNAYNRVSKMTDLLLRNLNSEESSEVGITQAQNGLETQIESYRIQLESLDEKINANNSIDYETNMSALEKSIQKRKNNAAKLKLAVNEAREKIAEYEAALHEEPKHVIRKHENAIRAQQQLEDAQKKLESLKAVYTDDYPDLIQLRHQIKNLEDTVENAQMIYVLNPAYAALEDKIRTQQDRLSENQERLNQTLAELETEQLRRDDLSAQQAGRKELLNEYKVAKAVYEGLLSQQNQMRKTVVRPQSNSPVVRVQQAAVVPGRAEGLEFIQYALLGPIVGLLLPLGLLVLYVQVDPRIRMADSLEKFVDLPVLAIVPPMNTPLAKKTLRSDITLLGAFLAIVLGIYIALALAFSVGGLG